MVHFVGAGSGAADLITIRGAKLIEQADVIIYAGSLVNPALLDRVKETAEIHNSAYMTLDEVIGQIEKAERLERPRCGCTPATLAYMARYGSR